jgi:membrane-associated phospholipid phosphatase
VASDAGNLPPLAARKTKPHRPAPPLPYLGIVVALAVFAVLATFVELIGKPCFAWDARLSEAVQAAPWPRGFEQFMRGVSWAGDNVFLAGVVVAGAALILFAFGARREAVVVLLAVIVEQIVKITIKEIIARPRPTSEEGVNIFIHAKEVYSFPSGHTVHYVVFFGFLWYLTMRLVGARRLRWPLLAVLGTLIALVGLSRVYLGAHWPSDILGGYLLGGAILTATVCFYRWWGRQTRAVKDEAARKQGGAAPV